jgi:tRNA pseudouridine38-40 synthase
LVLAYDGTDFRGFAPQRDVRTVAGVLTDALAKALRTEPGLLDVIAAGRTDAGVHAWGQVVSVSVAPDTDPWHVARVVNRLTGPELVVRTAALIDPAFHARHSAQWRTYRYTVVNRPEPDPFLARYAWWVPDPLELAQLRLAADPFVGEHDFTAFCRRPRGTGTPTPPGTPTPEMPTPRTTIRRVLHSRWLEPRAGVLVYEVRARSFCWQMVRSMVGTIVEAGSGRRRPGDVLAILRSGDRSHAGPPAPAQGLCLWEVGYPA